MNQYLCKIISNNFITPTTFIIECTCPDLAKSILPGQFCNIKVSESAIPLLRRPFSISNVNHENISFMINLHGKGTEILASKKTDDYLDVLGPLGNGFNFNSNDFSKAIIIAGGIGVAPFPYLISNLNLLSIKSECYLGFRTENEIITNGILNYSIATNDGSFGLEGNVIDLLQKELKNDSKYKLFACGPTPMLRAVQKFAADNNYNCEISTESVMACGFGICQGCPIESTHQEDHYMLVCKDGPVFNSRDVIV